MTAMFAGPYVPVGYDLGFPLDSLSEEEETLSLPCDFDYLMTQTYSAVLEGEASFWASHSPTSPRGNVAGSPPRQDSGQAPAASQGSASLSPTEPIYTPRSSLLDYDEENTGLGNAATSPDSNRFSADDYVYVDGSEVDVGNGSGSVTSQPPRPSGVISSPHLALGSSYQQFLPTPSRSSQHPQWQRLSSSPSNTSMEDDFTPYATSADLGLSAGSWAEEDLLSNASGFNTSFASQTYGTSFRTPDHGFFQQLPSASNGMSLSSPQALALQAQSSTSSYNFDAAQPTSSNPTGAPLSQHHNAGQSNVRPFTQRILVQAQAPSSALSQPRRQQQIVPSQARGHAQSQHLSVSVPRTSVSVNDTSASQVTKTQQQRSHLDYTSSSRLSSLGARRRQQISPAPYVPATTAVQGSRPLVKRDPGHTTGGPIRSSQTERTKRGGRERDSHLSDATRQKSHEMRKRGACWRCAMQRDQCDHGEPCRRCLNRAAKGQMEYFECDRSKLPDFVCEFLPESITAVFKKQPIEDYVNSQVDEWDRSNQLDLYLTVQYGEPLVWKCYEFKPKTYDPMRQLQIFRDYTTVQSVRCVKYALPFGLMKIDTSDESHFNAYLDRLMQPKYLDTFGWCFYEEENMTEPRNVQAQLLDFMCTLYMDTTDMTLRTLLKDIIRMLIITFIIDHTLSIVETNLPTVMSSIRHTPPPPNTEVFTSPKLANRQLKFFFGVLRAQTYEKILKWQQQTFHTGGKKESTWIHSFCAMLGFAMVLEEVQRSLHSHAESFVEKRTMSPDAATRQAENDFNCIDERYKFLIGLFQCKYRDKTWTGNGSFGPHTPQLTEHPERQFLYSVQKLLVQEQHHFKSRQNVPFGNNTQCFYTSRQTARFLLPFLEQMTYGPRTA